MSSPWRGWWHCNGTFKGGWLRGDGRGWRSRHHREHVEGDYRNRPPPHAYAAEFQRSKSLMSEEPVVLDAAGRSEMCRLLAGALGFYGVEVAELSVGAAHYHVLARFPVAVVKHEAQGDSVPATGVAGLCAAHQLNDGRDPLPRYLLGKCHSWASREFKKWMQAQAAVQSPGIPVPETRSGKIPDGGLFAPRPHCKPINDVNHFANAKRYIYDHVHEGAAVWSILLSGEK
jgi:hypothetical protein